MDIFTYMRLEDLQRSVNSLRRTTSIPNPFAPKQGDVETLQQEVGELRLLVAALYRLLLDKRQMEMTEILALLSTLDAADGKRDGQFQGDAVTGTPRAEPPPEDTGMPKIRVT